MRPADQLADLQKLEERLGIQRRDRQREHSVRVPRRFPSLRRRRSSSVASPRVARRVANPLIRRADRKARPVPTSSLDNPARSHLRNAAHLQALKACDRLRREPVREGESLPSPSRSAIPSGGSAAISWKRRMPQRSKVSSNWRVGDSNASGSVARNLPSSPCGIRLTPENPRAAQMAASGLPASARLAFTPISRARRAIAAATSWGKPKSRSSPETSKASSDPVGHTRSLHSGREFEGEPSQIALAVKTGEHCFLRCVDVAPPREAAQQAGNGTRAGPGYRLTAALDYQRRAGFSGLPCRGISTVVCSSRAAQRPGRYGGDAARGLRGCIPQMDRYRREATP